MESIMIELIPRVGALDWRLVPWVDMGMGMLSEGVVGLVIGVAQWPVLRRRVRGAGWWIFISTLAWAGNAILVTALGRTLFGADDESMWRLISLIGGIMPGLVTATGMVWLLSRSGKDAVLRS
jgi:hypothetical protein